MQTKRVVPNRLLSLGLMLCAAASVPVAADTPYSASLIGVWMLQKKTFAASGTMYTEFVADGACTQVLKLMIVGITHWGADRCSWSRDASQLSITIVSSPTQPDKVGDHNVVPIVSLTADTLTIRDKKDEQIWSRVPSIPVEFADQFRKAYAAAAPASQSAK